MKAPHARGDEGNETIRGIVQAEQWRALGVAQRRLLRAVVAWATRLDDAESGEYLQARVDAAIEPAEALGTPWFAPEYVFNATRTEIDGLALADAEGTFYPDLDGMVLSL